MDFITFINSGSHVGIHKALYDWAMIKLACSEKSNSFDKAWSATGDDYTDRLLGKFVGVSFGGSIRIFFKVLLANELANYLMTGNKNEELVRRIEEADKYFWCEGYGYNRKLLTQYKS